MLATFLKLAYTHFLFISNSVKIICNNYTFVHTLVDNEKESHLGASVIKIVAFLGRLFNQDFIDRPGTQKMITPLQYAINQEDTRSVKALLECGANSQGLLFQFVNCKEDGEITVSRRNYQTYALEKLDPLCFFEELLEAGMDISCLQDGKNLLDRCLEGLSHMTLKSKSRSKLEQITEKLLELELSPSMALSDDQEEILKNLRSDEIIDPISKKIEEIRDEIREIGYSDLEMSTRLFREQQHLSDLADALSPLI